LELLAFLYNLKELEIYGVYCSLQEQQWISAALEGRVQVAEAGIAK